jgi:exodeoxyribonuclease V gamma subunit
VAIDVVSALSADKILPILAERLSKPLDDPFAPDIVVVPGIGIADWIQEQLSLQFGSRGIVANTKFWLPNEFNAIVSASADHGVKMPDATALQWVVFEYLSKKAVEGVEPAPGFNLAKRKLSFAKRVAELFDRYAVHRPEMILDWNAGKDTDGASPLSDNQKWQPILWRELQSTHRPMNQKANLLRFLKPTGCGGGSRFSVLSHSPEQKFNCSKKSEIIETYKFCTYPR